MGQPVQNPRDPDHMNDDTVERGDHGGAALGLPIGSSVLATDRSHDVMSLGISSGVGGDSIGGDISGASGGSPAGSSGGDSGGISGEVGGIGISGGAGGCAGISGGLAMAGHLSKTVFF